MNVVGRRSRPKAVRSTIGDRKPVAALGDQGADASVGIALLRQFLGFACRRCLRLAIFLRWRGGFRAPLLL